MCVWVRTTIQRIVRRVRWRVEYKNRRCVATGRNLAFHFFSRSITTTTFITLALSHRRMQEAPNCLRPRAVRSWAQSDRVIGTPLNAVMVLSSRSRYKSRQGDPLSPATFAPPKAYTTTPTRHGLQLLQRADPRLQPRIRPRAQARVPRAAAARPDQRWLPLPREPARRAGGHRRGDRVRAALVRPSAGREGPDPDGELRAFPWILEAGRGDHEGPDRSKGAVRFCNAV